MNKNKVFCIGLHKTGTTSLQYALEAVDYRVASFFGINDPDISRNAVGIALSMMENYDAAQDDPWNLLFRELDRGFPGSKFILTTRNSDDWYKSCLRHFGKKTNYVREWFYGVGLGAPFGNMSHWIESKEKHEASVREYFIGRCDDYLELNISSGQGWERLGPFLGLSNYPDEFPKINTAVARGNAGLYMKYEKSRGIKRIFYRARMKFKRIFYS